MTTISAGQTPTAAQLNVIQTVVKAASQTVNNSATLVNDGELTLPVDANTTYVINAAFLHSSNSTADIKIGLTYPTGSTCSWGAVRQDVTVSTPTGAVDLGSGSGVASGNTYTGAGTGATQINLLMGSIIVGSTSGAIQIQFAQNTANASNTIMLAGSYLMLIRQ